MKLWELIRLPASRKRILISHPLIKSRRKYFLYSYSLSRYFTNVVCGMNATGEDDHLICSHNFSSSDYYFVYSTEDENVVGLL